MAPIDPHSFTDSAHPLTTHISLTLYFDFPSSTISAATLLSLAAPYSGDLTLDTRSLSISAVLDPLSLTPLPFSLSPSPPDPIIGQSLTISLSNQAQLLVLSKTSPVSSALQWVSPPQTFNKTLPFVYTQCQSIHARSIFPCQDTPAARIKYTAKINIPSQLSAVMSAKHVVKRPPLQAEAQGACEEAMWCGDGRAVEEFVMEQPIPPYLFAFAIGELGFREVGPRTKVYSEAVPAVLDAAAGEFAETEEMIKVGERLFGPYEWERFDLLVLPPSFPYGGMENPRMVFLTPTVIKGDASGAQVVAHELAHSWTGNLITNKTNNHFWLNEGWTTYAERRIVEAVQGENRATLSIALGWKGLVEDMERFKDNLEFTKLKMNQAGIDPDDVYSRVPYEKGFQFLWRIERQIGRPAFDDFLKKYIATFKFQSIDTDMFLDFLKENVPGIENEIDLKLWTEGTGIPPDAMEIVSNIYTKIVSLANEFNQGKIPRKDEVSDWRGQEWELYLKSLPKSVEASQIKALDTCYRLSESKNYEVKVAFLQLAISARCSDYFSEVEKTLKEVGRMKYLRPLYTALVQGDGKEEEKAIARRVFSEACGCYHPIAKGVVEAILAKYEIEQETSTSSLDPVPSKLKNKSDKGKALRRGLSIEGYQIEGISIAGHETCVIIPTLNLAFDIGKCPQRAVSQQFIFISHGHMDHIGGLPMHVATRGLYRMMPPTIIVPKAVKECVERIFEAHRAMDQSELKHTLIALDVGEEFFFRKDLKVRAFRTYHVIPSQGYIVYSVRHKLKQEYIGLPSEEIKKLKSSCVEITNTVNTPEIAFTGDTMSDFILDNDNIDVLRAKILIMESTYVEETMTAEDAREYGHTHLSEIVKYADRLENKAILLIHFSARYQLDVIQKAVSALPPPLAGRVFALTEGF